MKSFYKTKITKNCFTYLLILLAAIILAVLYIFNASRAGRRVEGCPSGCAVEQTSPQGSLRIMSFNMLHGFPKFAHLDERLSLIEQEIQEKQPDIVILQEVPWRWQLGGSAAARLAGAAGMNWLYLRSNGNRWAILFEEGEAILSRYPLDEIDFTEMEPRDAFFEHRMLLTARAITPQGALRIFATHLTTGPDNVKSQQTDSLEDFVHQFPGELALIGGDFNAVPGQPQIELLSQNWIDSYHQLHPEDPGLTCCVESGLTNPDQSMTRRIDYIFIANQAEGYSSNAIRPLAEEIIFDQPIQVGDGWLWASDHAGLLMDFQLGN
jgi:endonuclease/exonuclease/phosphatase family metal-dependent hydrolase